MNALPPPPPSPRRILMAATAAALGLRLYIHLLSPVIPADAALYLHSAVLLMEDPGRAMHAMEVHPLFPWVVAVLGRLIPDLATAGALVSILAAGATVWPLYALFRPAWEPRLAVGACFLFALHPILAAETADALPTSLQIFLFVGALACGWRALEGGPWPLFPLAGLSGALAYLTRTEGLLSLVLLAAAALAALIRRPAADRKRLLLGVAAAGLAAAAVAGPYVAFVSRKAGRFAISAKGGGTVLVEAMKGQTTEKRDTDAAFPFLPTLQRKLSYAVFAPLLPFLAAGFYLERKESRRRLGHLLIALAPLGPPILLFALNRHFRPSHRYFLVGVTLLLPWMASSMSALLEALRKRFPAKPTAAVAGVLLLALLVGKNLPPHRPQEKVLREAGAWLAAHPPAPPPWRLLSSSDKLSWYAGALHVPLVVGAPEEAATRTLSLCRAAGARAVAVDGTSVSEIGGASYLDALARAGFVTLRAWPAEPGRLAVWILAPPPP